MKRIGPLFLFLLISFATTTLLRTHAQEKPQIITFDAPGAGTGSGQGTVPRSINSTGEITGEYYDSNEAVHGFVRVTDGTIATLDQPGASTGDGQGTFPTSINPSGEIAGFYYDASDPSHIVTRGFVRDRDGVISTFDGLAMSINPGGQTTGTDSASHGFVRDRDGTITTFDAGPIGTIGTFPQSISPNGEITGFYDFASGSHGFLRDKHGKITTFDAGPDNTQGLSINPKGEIAGVTLTKAALSDSYATRTAQ